MAVKMVIVVFLVVMLYSLVGGTRPHSITTQKTMIDFSTNLNLVTGTLPSITQHNKS
jgi:uncharacterized membrane protein